VVVFGAIKVLAVSGVSLVVVFRTLHVEVANPPKLTVHIAVLGDLGVLWNTRALHLILFIRIHGLLLRQLSDLAALSLAEVFIEVLFVEVVVISVVETWSDRVSGVPAGVTQLTIVSEVVQDLLLGHFEPSRIAHSTCKFKNAPGVLAPKWRVAVFCGYWRSHLSEDTHILSLLHAVHR